MNNKERIQKKVEKTFRALDDLEPAKTDPFFYSRVLAKLEHRHAAQSEQTPSVSFGFTFGVAAVLLIVSLNLISIAQYQQIFTGQDAVSEEWADELAAEYEVFDLYYYESIDEE